MAAHLFSRLDPFDCQKGDFDYYLEQFEHFLVLNSVNEESKKVPLFISSIGQEAYKILKEICAPSDPKERSFGQLKSLLQEYFARREFYRRNQRPGEYTGAFINELKRLSAKCNFGPFAHDALRDRIACGKLPEDKADKKPPPPSSSSSVPTVAPVSRKGQSVPPIVAEVAAAKTKKQLQTTLESLMANLGETKKQQKGPKPQASGSGNARMCKICGHPHKENECPHKDASCFMCRKKGHIASVCREKANKGQQQQQPPVQVHVHVQQNTGVKK
ncbi:uncharacterized protein LOC135703372 [Ochlerotatus camptorhynchus]|uniref:uncharacterized protein LOC135703372 n=1 Tax=Ochlerotatus camptorhynchus TaxID=644619 RepID=UPI0031E09DEC